MSEDKARAFMRHAIEISRDEMRQTGAAPFAAVVVKDGEIVGRGVNQVVTKCDPTSHGEVEAIRDACQRLGTWDLSGCELYTTCEPCELCVAAMFWARIARVYYANRLSDCEELGFVLQPLHDLMRAEIGERAMPHEPLLRDEALPVLKEWAASPAFDTFQG